MSTQFDVSRRDFLVKLTIAGGALQAWPAVNWIATADASVVPAGAMAVVSFHMDQPYLDSTGTAAPYLPPAGSRSAEPLCACDDELLRYHHCYAI
jgi:hypothetical protein